MPDPALYLDECVDFRLARALRRRGFDVLTVQDAENRGHDDEAQLLFATQQGRLFLSHNQIDFRRLHASFLRDDRAHAGILLIPQTLPISRLEARAFLLLDWISTMPQQLPHLFTWGQLQQQLIAGFRLPHWDEDDVRLALGWA